jgi:NAD-dependent deacetylase
MKHLVVLTGAGMSAESGIKTFCDSGGLWEEHDVMQVASYDGWLRNKELVLRFYNERRRQLKKCNANKGHFGLSELEKFFNVDIITQNVDNLHERAGSSKILHLHGELTKIRSCTDEKYIIDIGYKDISLGDYCPKGGQLRPHIVWFGEAVSLIDTAAHICEEADIFVIIGSSLNVYPAAGLINFVPGDVPVFVVDPKPVMIPTGRKIEFIKAGAEEGVKILTDKLLKLHI